MLANAQKSGPSQHRMPCSLSLIQLSADFSSTRIHAWWQIPIFIALLLIPDSTPRWSKYAVLAVLLVDPDAQPLIVGWCSVVSKHAALHTITLAQ